MVPVFDPNLVPLMPCTNKRAWKLMTRKTAKPYWRKGIFCIVLQRPPSGYAMQDVVVAIDPGSKRTGVTVATPTKVVTNFLANTPSNVKAKVEQRKDLRRTRRSRNRPYRKCRSNRKIGGLPPSTKARWQAHLRLIDLCRSLFKVTLVVIEDIAARTRANARRWNVNFSPLQVGKQWFANKIAERNLPLCKFRGYETAAWRSNRAFNKASNKLADVWEAHNVDSHCLAEMAMGKKIDPVKHFYRINFLQPHRRQLHVTNAKKGKRRRQGGTTTNGIQRGTLVRHIKYGLTQIGGFCKTGITLTQLFTGIKIVRSAKLNDLAVVGKLNWRIKYC